MSTLKLCDFIVFWLNYCPENLTLLFNLIITTSNIMCPFSLAWFMFFSLCPWVLEINYDEPSFYFSLYLNKSLCADIFKHEDTHYFLKIFVDYFIIKRIFAFFSLAYFPIGASNYFYIRYTAYALFSISYIVFLYI